MCGINGILSKKVHDDLIVHLNKMNEEILHRGPDDDGFFVDVTQAYSIGMAMRRLSIIDLDTGKQPIFSEDGRFTIVFNGEIYNYQLLRHDLEITGAKFTTQSDTEVILKLFERYGVESFSMLDGMFSFSIFDKKLNKLFIARDFFGEKPLYFFQTNDKFYWSSELKSIISQLERKPEINKIAVSLFFQLTYIPSPHTIYEGIKKLQPNHYIEFDCVQYKLEIIKIQQAPNKFFIPNKKSAIKLTHDFVNESVQSRSIADVSVGTFLSGGVDSSIVSLCLSQQQSEKINTFSIGFKNKAFDESEKARTVSKIIDSKHLEFQLDLKDIFEVIDETLNNFDEPYADSSALVSYILSKKSRQFVKVALTGDGGDEVFGGYNKYYMGKLNTLITTKLPKNVFELIREFSNKYARNNTDHRGLFYKLNRLLGSVSYDDDFYKGIISLGFNSIDFKGIFNENFQKDLNSNILNDYFLTSPKSLFEFREIDLKLSLDGDLLVKTDRSSMLASLETRSPFLNKKLWNFTEQLPESYLINGWDKKHILKEAFKDYFPKGFLNKPKMGFGVPVGNVLRTELKLELLKYSSNEYLNAQNIFNVSSIQKLIQNHLSSVEDSSFKVWTFFCFQKWYDNIYRV